MSVRVTVVDEQTGETQVATVPDDDYFIVAVGECYVSYVQAFKNGTHILTVKGRRPGLRGGVRVHQIESEVPAQT